MQADIRQAGGQGDRFFGAAALVCATEYEFESVGKILDEITVINDGLIAGFICGKPVLLMQAGVGKVNAAVATACLIGRFRPSAVVSFGACGALTGELSIYDVIVADSAYQHDFDSTALGEADCCICGMDIVYFPADARITNALADACSAKRGILATGDQFIEGEHNKARAARLGGVVCDMEGAAVAQACHILDTPFAAVKVVSDSSNPVEYMQFLSRALQILAEAFKRYFSVQNF